MPRCEVMRQEIGRKRALLTAIVRLSAPKVHTLGTDMVTAKNSPFVCSVNLAS